MLHKKSREEHDDWDDDRRDREEDKQDRKEALKESLDKLKNAKEIFNKLNKDSMGEIDFSYEKIKNADKAESGEGLRDYLGQCGEKLEEAVENLVNDIKKIGLFTNFSVSKD